MRVLVVLLLALSISGCAEFSKSKVEKDGTYRFKKEPYIVWAPNECLLDMFVYDSDVSVDFTTGRGYWMASGQYALQVMPIPEHAKDPNSFVAATKEFAPLYAVKDRERLGLKLQLKEEKQIKVNGQPGYQVISAEEGKAVFVATFVLQRHRITVASLVYPAKPGVPATEQIPWGCYKKFVDSVRETQ